MFTAPENLRNLDDSDGPAADSLRNRCALCHARCAQATSPEWPKERQSSRATGRKRDLQKRWQLLHELFRRYQWREPGHCIAVAIHQELLEVPRDIA